MKMKNRLLPGILCLLMFVCCVLGLTACHGDNKCAHQWGEWAAITNPTCTEAGVQERKCSVCEETEESALDPLGHDWKDATCSTPKTCKVCSATEGSDSPLEHKDENADHICDFNCGKRNMGAHADEDKDGACDYGCATPISTDETANEATYVELGIPSSLQHDKDNRATCPWDLFFYDGILYVGAGDYDKNAGPITVWGYDTAKQKWIETGTLADEEVSKFLLIDGVLTVPGTDPQGDWSYGNYYQLKNGEWITYENVPDGIHMFDMVEYEGALFAGLGVLPGKSPVVRSVDGGESFSPIPLKRDGAILDTSIYQEVVRVYDFFVCGGELYALFIHDATDSLAFDLYRYTEGVFSYVGAIPDSLSFFNITSKLINAKVTFKDRLFFTTGYLYVADDMASLTTVTPPHSMVVYDLLVDGDRLYALSVEKDTKDFRVSVSSTETGEAEDFKEEFYFYYSAPPISFEKDGQTFYFGMGDQSKQNENNGMILKVTNE